MRDPSSCPAGIKGFWGLCESGGKKTCFLVSDYEVL